MTFQGFQSFNQFTVPSCFAGFLKIVIFILLTTRHHYWIFQTEAIIKTNGYSKFDDLWLLILADMVQNVIIIISLSHGYTWTKLIDFCSFILELLYFKWKKKKKSGRTAIQIQMYVHETSRLMVIWMDIHPDGQLK